MNKKIRISALTASVLTLAVFSAGTASAQVEQKPYILFVMDTSGSTEWTPAGDERYPNLAATAPDQSEWVPGTDMQLGSDTTGKITGNIADGPARFGPCFVWEVDQCDKYRRPPWTFRYNDWQDVFSSQALMVVRKNQMLGVSVLGVHNGVRMSDASQPRHVILKEVLTGDMLLRATGDTRDYQSLNALSDGPGCWFVPRQRDASVQRPEDRFYCEGEGRFESLPDHDEPRPHFQEVFDAQLSNGVLDKLSSEAIFGVAMLDGYREDVSGWPHKLNDSVDGDDGIDGSNPAGARDSNSNGEDSGSPYNLGVYRIVGPKRIDLPSSFLDQLSNHVQQTIIEAGFLREDGKAGEIDVKKGIASLGLAYDKKADKYIENKYEMAKHPIARATPLAAAIMDVHQFLANDERFEKGDHGSQDPYAECRPKQIVLISDGYPEPEKSGGFSGSNIGSEALTPAFGYDPALYPYRATEDEIEALTSNTSLYGSQPDAARRYGPRVHVVALSVSTDATTKTQILTKLSAMAKAGKTCAEYYLPDHVPTAADPSGATGNCVAGCSEYTSPGVCKPGTSLCLVGPQTPYTYTPPNPNVGTFTCNFPALVLGSNDRAAMEKAVFSIASGIIGGSDTLTRTRAAISNFLDDDDFTAGGQYRTFSGVQTLGSYWRGILNREIIPCDTTGTPTFSQGSDAADAATAGIKTSGLGVRALHADIGDQVNCGVAAGGQCATSPPTDNRRIFTSLPTDAIYDYGGRSAKVNDLGGRMHFLWDPITIGQSEEEFRDSSFPNVPSPAALLVGTRIPLRAAQLHKALQNATVPTWTDQNSADFLNAYDYADLEGVIKGQRGQTPAKGTNDRATSRVFSGILNSDPIVVPPPILDLPIESYRAFRAFYGDRPTMLYSATVDGQLHAIHMGDLKGRILVREQTADNTWNDLAPSNTLGAEVDQSAGVLGQREAWSYVPNILLRQLAYNTQSQGYLMDGATVVRDVRLCQANADSEHNQNNQACRAIATTGFLTAEQQWRTVLVQAMGRAGGGYFAMDVTRTGGLRPGAVSRTVQAPDPAILWEFDRSWETAQVKALAARDPELVFPPTSLETHFSDPDAVCSGPNDFWGSPAMGLSISAPEIATLAIDMMGSGGIQQRPVAVFAAGATDDNVDGCGAGLQGSAIYVIDLQTGTLLRRFVTYNDGPTERTFAKSADAGFEARFGRVQLTGSPALYDASTGSLASRGFVGDSIGRLYRMNFQDPNPANWGVDLFFDPYASTDLQSKADTAVGASDVNFGPAAFKPAISRGPNRQLVVTYGLGETSDSPSPTLAQAVITVAETDGAAPNEVRWYRVLEKGEKLMGEPLVFNSVAYFPTYWVQDADVCLPGRARVWGVDYFASNGTDPVGTFDFNDPDFAGGDIDTSPGASLTSPALWFSPKESTVIRGLTLTLGPVCSVRDLNGDGANSADTAGMDTQPQLIAQTGAPAGAMSGRLKGDSSADAIGRLTKNIKRPRSMTIPLSWSVIQ